MPADGTTRHICTRSNTNPGYQTRQPDGSLRWISQMKRGVLNLVLKSDNAISSFLSIVTENWQHYQLTVKWRGQLPLNLQGYCLINI